MRKTTSWVLFLILLFTTIQFKLQIGAFSDSKSVFLLMLLAIIGGVLSGGLRMGILMLSSTVLVISYFFLSPQNLFLLTEAQLQQIVLFFIEGLVVIFLIHILKRAKEEEHALREQFQVILSSIGDSVIATDRNGNITYMNARSQKITGWRFHNAKTKHIGEVLTFKDRQRVEELYTGLRQVLREGKTLSFQTAIPVQTKHKKKLSLQYTLAPLCNIEGKTIGIVLIFRDVTDHKDMETQREVLLGSISHELKNHMTSIQGYAHILQKKLEKTEQADYVSLIEKLNGKIGVMSQMISGMLDLSKIKVGKLDMNIEDFNLLDLTESIVNDQKMSTQYDIIIQSTLEHFVKGDKIRIGQVLTNLISNAVKYSPENKEVIVSLKREDHEAVVSVKDFGLGIAQDQIDKIFQPFYRAANDHDRAKISGSGLGLYISQAIVHQNSGELWVKSTEGKGSTFYFTLPLAEQVEAAPSRESSQGIMNRIRDLLKMQYAT